MTRQIRSIEIHQLLPHPGNCNRMSKENFRKLVRHIERTGRYEPLVIRPLLHDSPATKHETRFQIINGHHRFEALKQLGYETCDCIVWDVDDEEALLLLATLNRLCGSDVLEKKTALLEKLNRKLKVDELAKLLPQTKTQIQRLIDLHKDKLKIELAEPSQHSLPHPLVFFLSEDQKQTVERALALADCEAGLTHKAERNAQALTHIASQFISAAESQNV